MSSDADRIGEDEPGAMNDLVRRSLPGSWLWTTISDLGKVVSGGTPSTKDPSNWSGGVNWITPADLSNYSGKYISRGAKSLSERGLNHSSATLMPAGSIHFSSRAPIGYVAISASEISTNQGFKSLVPSAEIFNEYIYYYLKSAKRLGEKLASGTTFLELSGSAFKKLPVPLPPINEQRRIVAKLEELFSELDAGVESLTTAHEQLMVYRQALLKHAFEGKLTAQWRTENADKLETAEQLLQRIRAENEERYQRHLSNWEIETKGWDASGGGARKPPKPRPLKPPRRLAAAELAQLPTLPRGWNWLEVASLCEVVRGGSPRPAGDPKFYGGDIPFLKVGDITNRPGAHLHNFSHTITAAGLNKTRRVTPGTLLLSNSGATLGVPKICMIEATMNDGIAAFIGLPESSLLYHYYFWQSKTQELRAIDQGAAQPNLNTDLIKGVLIPVCSPSEQFALTEALERRLSICEVAEHAIADAMLRANALRESILKRAFSGQLVPQDPSDEPASVLLERICAEKAKADGGKTPRKQRRARKHVNR